MLRFFVILSIAIIGVTAQQAREYEATKYMFPKTRSFLNKIKTMGTCIGRCPSFNDKLYFTHYLPHDDCDKYCMCMMGGYKLTRSCNGNYHYSELLNKCVNPKEAKCINKFDGCLGNCTMDRDGNFETVLFAHQDCNKFCRCKENGRLELLTCADNLHFSVEHNCCVDPEEAKCKIEVPKPNTATEDDKVGADANQLNANGNNQSDTEQYNTFDQTGANQLNTDGHNQLDNNEDKKLPFLDENDNEDVTDELDADKNSIEDHSLDISEDKEEIEVPAVEEDSADEKHDECIGNCSSCGAREPCLLPHKNCSRFCVCVDGFPFAKNCSAGLCFDAVTRECVVTKYARCESGDGTEAGLKPSVEGSEETGGNQIEATAGEHENNLAADGPGPNSNNVNENSETGAQGNESAAVSSSDVRYDDHYDEENDDHVDNGHDDKSNLSHVDEIPKEDSYVDNHQDDGNNNN